MSAELFDVDRAVSILGRETQVVRGQNSRFGEGVNLTVPSGDMLAVYDGHIGLQSQRGPLVQAVFAGDIFSLEYAANQHLLRISAANPTRMVDFSPDGIYYVLFNDHLYTDGTPPQPMSGFKDAETQDVQDPQWGKGKLLGLRSGRMLGEYTNHVSIISPFGHAVFNRHDLTRKPPQSDAILFSSTNPDGLVNFSGAGVEILLYSREWPAIPGVTGEKKGKKKKKKR